MALIIPKNNAEEKTLDATLKIYYDANDWVTNEVLINKLSSALDNLGIEDEKKEPQSYTKKTQVLAYYGFIVWEDETNSQSKRKITELGKRFYEAKSKGDSSHIIETLIESLNKCTFGRNVTGCNSDSDLEPPNIFLKSALLLDGLNLNEFAYILQKMEFDNAELADAIFDISLHRKMGQPVSPNDQAAKWKDPKPILALGNWGLFSVEKKDGLNSYCLNKYVIENYSKELMALRTKNTETLRFVMKGIDDNYNGNSKGLQIIYYGAPGTGKSTAVKKQTGELLENGEERDLVNVFRTTFHPDTDYASFVGCYKPTMKPTSKEEKTLTGKDEEIVYEFVPQAFTDAYVYAYNNPATQTYLVIEEINRGNCAQIFGDLFQLLDRKGGKSEYKIKADKDLANYLLDKLGADSEGIKDGKLSLPANLNILATMNTSDQSLFPMDSAFKRRWEWEYVPINYGTDIKSGTFEITIGENPYPWINFIKEANKRIFDLTQSEDKQLGNFFIKHSVDEKEFKSKVMFYLWYEVLRDETENNKYFFHTKTTVEGKEITDKFTFKDLYEQNATETLQHFMEYLCVSSK